MKRVKGPLLTVTSNSFPYLTLNCRLQVTRLECYFFTSVEMVYTNVLYFLPLHAWKLLVEREEWHPACKYLATSNPQRFFRTGRPGTICAGGHHSMPPPLQVDLLTLKVVSESHVSWATSVPILVFLGLSVFDLGPMYATDIRQMRTAHHRLMPPSLGAGA